MTDMSSYLIFFRVDHWNRNGRLAAWLRNSVTLGMVSGNVASEASMTLAPGFSLPGFALGIHLCEDKV